MPFAGRDDHGSPVRGHARSNAVLIVVAVVAAAVAAGGYLRGAPPPTTDRIYLRSIGGAVVFGHAEHQARVASCLPCHHELILGDPIACATCHDADVTFDLASHDELVQIDGHTCDGCHASADATGARNCRACHASEVEGATSVHACSDCHDDATYGPATLPHASLVTIEGHSCDGCHTPRALAEAYHATCNGCHLRAAPQRFAAADGGATCAACHLK